MRSADTARVRSASLSQRCALFVIAAAAALALGLHGAIPQPADYHAFADARGWLGLPNAANVLSNLPFALIGLSGLWRLSAVPHSPARTVWRCFCAALACTGLGSAIYHWAPANASLVLDRLPIAWACAALLCAFLSERIDAAWGQASTLCGAFIAATASVAWWWLSERQGHDDLRPYLYLQFLPMLLVPAALCMKLRVQNHSGVPDGAWWAVLALYAAAKLMEFADHSVFDAIAFTSGHTVKHLLAAAAALCVVRAAVGNATPQLR